MKKLLAYASTLCFIAIIVIILLNIFFRGVLNQPFTWTYELSSILIIWGVYLVFGTNYRERKHFRIEIIHNFVSEKVSRALDIFSDIIVLITISFIIYYSFLAIEKNLQMTTMALDFPVPFAFYLPVLIGSSSMLIYMAMKYINRRKKREKSL